MSIQSTLSQQALQESINHTTQGRPFSLHHTDVSSDFSTALYLHCHSELEFLVLQQGELYFFVEDEKFHMKAGEMILIPGGLLHHATRLENDKTPCSFDAFVFSTDTILDTIPIYCSHMFSSFLHHNPCYLNGERDWHHTVIRHIQSIFEFYNVPIQQCELLVRGNLMIAWQLLYNNWFIEKEANTKLQPLYPLIDICIKKIDTEYMNTFSLQELCSIAGLSDGHFCRVFKTITGFTPFHYINRVRVAKACEFLTETNKNITEIASLCGFNNISYFNRVFKQIIKESPSAFRRNLLN